MEAERIRQEMKKELNLVSATDFQHALCEHVRVEFGKMADGAIARKQDQLAEAKGHSNAVISFDTPQPLFHKTSSSWHRPWRITSSRATPYIY